MPQRFDGLFEGYDQTELFFQTWTPESVRGVLIITHGLAEHSECYHPLAKSLCDDGWMVYAWDMRGHGRSEGKRGYSAGIKPFINDLELFVRKVRSRHKDQNLLLFGHSLGGMVTLRLMESAKIDCAALVLSAPCVGLTVKVPKLKEQIAHVANRWLPTLTMYNEVRYEDLSRDEEILKSYRTDTLRHDKISPGIFLGMLEAFPQVFEEAEKVDCPVLMQLAGEDRLVSTPAARELFEKLPNKKNQMIMYPESLHEIFNDLDRERALADLKRFVNPFLGA